MRKIKNMKIKICVILRNRYDTYLGSGYDLYSNKNTECWVLYTLLQTLLKHTDPSHPDHQLLQEAQREVHDLAMKINCTERETLKELEALIEGLIDLVAPERTFIRHDLVTMVSGQGTRKERALFLFSDLLVITSIKRKSGTIRKPSTYVVAHKKYDTTAVCYRELDISKIPLEIVSQCHFHFFTCSFLVTFVPPLSLVC